MGAWANKNPDARKQELEGFDFMDKTSIEPILNMVEQYRSGEVEGSQRVA